MIIISMGSYWNGNYFSKCTVFRTWYSYYEHNKIHNFNSYAGEY